MRVLVVNTGSSSIKLRLLGEDDDVLVDHHVERWATDDAASIAALLKDINNVAAVGHRVVHGGSDMRAPVLVDDDVERRIATLTPLAPLHQPRALAGVRAVRQALAEVPAVACFDTSYHATLPPAAATYALPAAWRQRWGLRRYGLHGLSHAYAARRAAEMLHREQLGVVSCHLGAGASLCATVGQRSVDTTMGFTPLEGLVMATRSGSVDPGLLLWLVTEAGMPAHVVSRALETESGLAGLTGRTGDMRDVLAARDAGDEHAVLAFDLYVHRLVKEIAAMTAALGRLNALVFTGGVGEHVPEVRATVASRLAFLGVHLDPDRNTAARADAEVSADGAQVATLVVEAREDLEIARQTRSLLAPAGI
jgi:acetate kinase